MTVQAFTSQLEKQYRLLQQQCILGQSFQPVELRGGKQKPHSTVQLHEAIRQFQQYEKKPGQPGWRIEWETWNSKKLGHQRWPAIIYIDTADDLVHLLQKQGEWRAFRQQVQILLGWRLAIGPWLQQQPGQVLALQGDWPGICAVVDFLLDHPAEPYYLRTLPVPVNTKFIERHDTVLLSLLKHFQPERFAEATELDVALRVKQKPKMIPLRWLDTALSQQYTLGMEAMGIPLEYLRQVEWAVAEIWLVENETNLYMLPPRPGGLALCSMGKALDLLAGIPLLQKTRLLYWGDLDETGLALLSRCRSMYPHTDSVLMDAVTVQAHTAEMEIQPNPFKKQAPEQLQPHELAAFELLKEANARLEQEKLQQLYVQQTIQQR